MPGSSPNYYALLPLLTIFAFALPQPMQALTAALALLELLNRLASPR